MVQKLVLDASVAAKWFLFDEPLSGLAMKFLNNLLAGEIEFHAPELLKYEMAEALHKAQQPFLEMVGQCPECGASLRRAADRPKNRLDRAACQDSYQAFCALRIEYHQPTDSEKISILGFCNQHNKHFYDACYFWLAEKLDCQLLTNDQKFMRNLPAGSQPVILLLSSLQ